MDRLPPGNRGQINVTGTILAVTQVALVFQDSQQGPDGRIAWRIGQSVQDFGDRGLPPLVNDVHDLAFPAAEMDHLGTLHRGTPPGC